jgi:hypothetical protein
VRGFNLGLKFALELVAAGALAAWGATAGSGVWAVVLAIAAPLVVAMLWGRFAAPLAPRRLPLRLRVPFELTIFALAALALLTASTALALTFTSAVIVNSLLLTVFGQWEAEQPQSR